VAALAGQPLPMRSGSSAGQLPPPGRTAASWQQGTRCAPESSRVGIISRDAFINDYVFDSSAGWCETFPMTSRLGSGSETRLLGGEAVSTAPGHVTCLDELLASAAAPGVSAEAAREADLRRARHWVMDSAQRPGKNSFITESGIIRGDFLAARKDPGTRTALP
jgi:hypothetical protein